MSLRKTAPVRVRFGKTARLAALALACILAPAGCAVTPEASPSAKFDRTSDKAVVLLGTNIEWYEHYSGIGRGIQTYWQEYDPKTLKLVPGGDTFSTALSDSIWSDSDYRKPTVLVMEVKPGNYALTAASGRENTTTFVAASDGRESFRRTGFLDPRDYVEPAAPVDLRRNFLFTVTPGQIVYIGHFEFTRALGGLDLLIGVNYSQDEAAARAALQKYSGIQGDIVVLNLKLPTEQAAR